MTKYNIVSNLNLIEFEWDQHFLIELFDVQVSDYVDFLRQIIRCHYAQFTIAKLTVYGCRKGFFIINNRTLIFSD